jgi:UDP-4-amino-4,6-dideoxy-N-acetyl-beta-L-altrosamine transaminase
LKDLPYSTQCVTEEDVQEVLSVLRSARLTQGPAVENFEEALAEKCHARDAVVVSSGTAALHLACAALGVRPGQRLLTSTLSFSASANCGLYCGAEPDFTDVDPNTGNMTPETVAEALKRGPADTIVVVHFGGRPANVEGVARVSAGATIIEDACHALGAETETSKGWSKVGSCENSLATVFSFHPVKPITTGEGGAVLTGDEAFARELRTLRSHGIVRDATRQAEVGGWFYEMQALGFNYRLTDFQAALGTAQLRRLDEGLAWRRHLVSLYRAAIGDLDGLLLPPPEDGVRSAWHLFPVRVRHPRASRRQVYELLHAQGIRVQVHYIPIHLQPYYRERFGFSAGQFPEAEAYYDEEISLPLFATMSESDVVRVAKVLRQALA